MTGMEFLGSSEISPLDALLKDLCNGENVNIEEAIRADISISPPSPVDPIPINNTNEPKSLPVNRKKRQSKNKSNQAKTLKRDRKKHGESKEKSFKITKPEVEPLDGPDSSRNRQRTSDRERKSKTRDFSSPNLVNLKMDSQDVTKTKARKIHTERGGKWDASTVNLSQSETVPAKLDFLSATAVDFLDATYEDIKLALDNHIADLTGDDLMEVSSSHSDYQNFETAFVQRLSGSRLHRVTGIDDLTRSEGRRMGETSGESGSESSGWITTKDLSSLRRRSGSEGLLTSLENTTEPESEFQTKKKSPVKINQLTHSSSVPNIKDKSSLKKSKSKKTLTPRLTSALVPKQSPPTDTTSEVTSPTTSEEVVVTAPTLVTPLASRVSKSNLNRQVITKVTKSQLNKDSHPPLPFTSWEEDGALRPPKNKIFGEKNSKIKISK